MKRYIIKTTDGSIARYTELYVVRTFLREGISFEYQTGTKIFYPFCNIVFMKEEVIDEDDEEV